MAVLKPLEIASKTDFMSLFVQGRKDVGMIVTNLLRQQVGQNRFLAAEYLEANRDLIDVVLAG